ncbi:hypothetical protein GCM10017744_000050 [Streptomyces antimycoticus]
MVIQCGVEEGIAGPALVLTAGRPAQGFVAAAIGDTAELLHIDVDQLARPGAFIAADGFAGGPVAGGKWWQAVALEDAVGGGGGDTGTGGQPQWADVVFTAHPQHPLLHVGGGPAW